MPTFSNFYVTIIKLAIYIIISNSVFINFVSWLKFHSRSSISKSTILSINFVSKDDVASTWSVGLIEDELDATFQERGRRNEI